MGGCFSVLKGGKHTIGEGAQHRPINNDGASNDAVGLINRSGGVHPLCTQLELSLSATNLLAGDIMSKTLSLKDQDFLGEGSCVLSEVVTKQSRSLTLNLHNKNGHGGLRNLGTLTVHAEETMASKSVVEIKFRCSHLENKALFYKSDPFLKISRIVESGGSVPICETEVVVNNLNPTWKPLSLSMQQFGSKDNPLIIECFDFKTNGNHVLIGKLVKSVADLERLYKEKSGVNFIIPSSRLGHEKVSNNGQLFVDQFCEKEQFSLKSCQDNS